MCICIKCRKTEEKYNGANMCEKCFKINKKNNNINEFKETTKKDIKLLKKTKEKRKEVPKKERKIDVSKYEIKKIYYMKKWGKRYINRFVIVMYKQKKYVVMETPKSKFFFDFNNLEKALKNNEAWNFSNKYIHNANSNKYFHNYINVHCPTGKGAIISYDHINRITTDNRHCNLRLISQTEQNKNQGKRKRSKKTKNDDDKYYAIQDESIKNYLETNIPKYISYWYEKGRERHRIVVDKKFPLHNINKYFDTHDEVKILKRMKEAKLYIQNKIEQNEGKLPLGYSLNGELSKKGKKLKQEYEEILELGLEIFEKNN